MRKGVFMKKCTVCQKTTATIGVGNAYVCHRCMPIVKAKINCRLTTGKKVNVLEIARQIRERGDGRSTSGQPDSDSPPNKTP